MSSNKLPKMTENLIGKLYLDFSVALNKKVLYIDMDNVLVDFQSGIDALSPNMRITYDEKYDETPGIFGKMKPLAGAVEAFHELVQIYDTYILSTAPWKNPSAWSDKRLWVEAWLGGAAEKRLILSHHKNLNDGDYLVDDRTARGADRFKGLHIHFGQPPYDDWEAVLKFLRANA